MARPISSLVKDIVKQQTLQQDPIANLYGVPVVFPPIPTPGVNNGTWVLHFLNTLTPYGPDDIISKSASIQVQADPILVANAGVVNYNSLDGTTMVSTTINTHQSISLPVNITCNGKQIRLYVGETLIRNAINGLDATITVPAGETQISAIIYGAGVTSASVTLPADIVCYVGNTAPPSPRWVDSGAVNSRYVDPVTGATGVALNWYNQENVGGWGVYTVTTTPYGNVGNFTLQGDKWILRTNFSGIPPFESAVVQINNVSIGTIDKAYYDDNGASLVLVVDAFNDFNNADINAMYSGIANILTFNNIANIGRTSSAGIITYVDTRVATGNVYSYCIDSYSSTDDGVRSNKSLIVSLTAGDVTPPGNAIITSFIIQGTTLTLYYTTPSDADYYATNAIFYYMGSGTGQINQATLNIDTGYPSRQDSLSFDIANYPSGTVYLPTSDLLGNTQYVLSGTSFYYTTGGFISWPGHLIPIFGTSSGAIMSGTLDMNGNQIIHIGTGASQFTSIGQLEIDLTTGTAPLIIASTTKVNNLNADLLDGLDSTAFPILSANQTWTGTDVFTNTTNFTGNNVFSGIVTFAKTTGTAPFVVNSTTLVTNLNADLFDGLDSTAFSQLSANNVFTGLNVFTQNIVFSGVATFGAQIAIDGPANTVRDLVFKTSGSNRWVIREDNDAETGSDFGTDFRLIARHDDGTPIDNVISILRRTGGSIQISSARPFVHGAGITIASGATAKINIDGVDASFGAGEIAIGESAGNLTITSRGGIQIGLDNDSTSTNAFTIGANGSFTGVFSVDETGILGLPLSTSAVGIRTGSPLNTLDVITLSGFGNYAVIRSDPGVAYGGGLLLTNNEGTSGPETSLKFVATFNNTYGRARLGWVMNTDPETFIDSGSVFEFGPHQTIGFAGTPFNVSSLLKLTGVMDNLTGSTHRAIDFDAQSNSLATVASEVIAIRGGTQAAAYTTAQVNALHVFNAIKGAGSTITTQAGIRIDDQTQGSTNFSIITGLGTAQFGDLVQGLNGASFTRSSTASAIIFGNGAAGWTGTQLLQLSYLGNNMLLMSTGGVLTLLDSGAATRFTVGTSGLATGIELGRTDGTAAGSFIDFHAGASAVDYDSRIIADTGGGIVGGGQMRIIANRFRIYWNTTTQSFESDTFGNIIIGSDPGGTANLRIGGDTTVGALGTLDSTATPTKDYLLSYNAAAAKWQPRLVQIGFNSGQVTSATTSSGFNGDNSQSAIVNTVTNPTGTPSAMSGTAPVLTPIYNGMIIDLSSSYPAGLQPGFIFIVDYSVNSGTTFTNGAMKSTATKLVHAGLNQAWGYEYRYVVSGSSSTGNSPTSPITKPSAQSETNAYGLIVASQIATINLSSISANIGDISAGQVRNSPNTAGILFSNTAPASWTQGIFFAGANPPPGTVTGMYIDFTATGTNHILHHQGLDLNANGSAVFSGTVNVGALTVGTISADITVPYFSTGLAYFGYFAPGNTSGQRKWLWLRDGDGVLSLDAASDAGVRVTSQALSLRYNVSTNVLTTVLGNILSTSNDPASPFVIVNGPFTAASAQLTSLTVLQNSLFQGSLVVNSSAIFSGTSTFVASGSRFFSTYDASSTTGQRAWNWTKFGNGGIALNAATDLFATQGLGAAMVVRWSAAAGALGNMSLQNGSVTIDNIGNMTLNKVITFNDVSVNGTLSVTGNSVFSGTAIVVGNAVFSGTVTSVKELYLNNHVWVSSGTQYYSGTAGQVLIAGPTAGALPSVTWGDPTVGAPWRRDWFRFKAASTSIKGDGIADPTLQAGGGSFLANNFGTGPALQFHATTGIGTQIYAVTTTFDLCQVQHTPTFYCKVTADTSIANLRFKVGLVSVAQTSNSETTDGSGILFKYSVSGTVSATAWTAVVRDGTTQKEVAIPNATVTIGNTYYLKCRVDGANKIAYFSVNGGPEVSINTNLPAITTGLGATASLTNIGATATNFNFHYFHTEFGT